ncbi:MAG: cupin domain-containing protein [Lentisphaeria bacterium]|nr:cupin domain-containing protein [Lentisphaeria bacterium]NQZ68664.1 cupin domain-containing protein [Lentisphaeria bacterium]
MLKNHLNSILGIAIVCLLTACQTAPIRVIFPAENLPVSDWSKADLEKNIAIKHLERTKTSSSHLIRLRGSEKPHFHDKHDLTVTVLRGESIIHFKSREQILKAGDVVHIPKGNYHWAENTGVGASVVFAVFSPAFDGKDKRFVDKHKK